MSNILAGFDYVQNEKMLNQEIVISDELLMEFLLKDQDLPFREIVGKIIQECLVDEDKFLKVNFIEEGD